MPADGAASMRGIAAAGGAGGSLGGAATADASAADWAEDDGAQANDAAAKHAAMPMRNIRSVLRIGPDILRITPRFESAFPGRLRTAAGSITPLSFEPYQNSQVACRSLILEVVQQEIGDAVEKLDARRSVRHAMAAARKDHQAGGIFFGEDQLVDHLRGVGEVDVVVARRVGDHQLALQICRLTDRGAVEVGGGIILRPAHVALGVRRVE